jgi:alkanesulfonate monooxygenase SsuD/methylene tetrahydromethanopterin reductase-like flavin-dependent oxidoreductase (luciferase family)
VVALSVLAEEAGYNLVSYNDHPYSPRSLDALALMSFLAARTGRVRLAANVLSLPLRPPAVLAQAVASLDILSHGRAEPGIGAGMAWGAIEAMGGRRLDPGDSVEALEEVRRLDRRCPRRGCGVGARRQRRVGHRAFTSRVVGGASGSATPAGSTRG